MPQRSCSDGEFLKTLSPTYERTITKTLNFSSPHRSRRRSHTKWHNLSKKEGKKFAVLIAVDLLPQIKVTKTKENDELVQQFLLSMPTILIASFALVWLVSHPDYQLPKQGRVVLYGTPDRISTEESKENGHVDSDVVMTEEPDDPQNNLFTSSNSDWCSTRHGINTVIPYVIPKKTRLCQQHATVFWLVQIYDIPYPNESANPALHLVQRSSLGSLWEGSEVRVKV